MFDNIVIKVCLLEDLGVANENTFAEQVFFILCDRYTEMKVFGLFEWTISPPQTLFIRGMKYISRPEIFLNGFDKIFS